MGTKKSGCRGQRRGVSTCRGVVSWAHMYDHVVEWCRGTHRGQHVSWKGVVGGIVEIVSWEGVVGNILDNMSWEGVVGDI